VHLSVYASVLLLWNILDATVCETRSVAVVVIEFGADSPYSDLAMNMMAVTIEREPVR
jgi:hypothetical protein